eukprot:TRINITY_DN5283_c0_g1_i1.p1 TRINITY_DN5283_c0_g1~~TRINITY_DN5283_c0_g1_i1.p1  ORF type:complete len:297 (+),score=48.15 TRINITY_DN5283_c0_g1_i1:750-1640(+)
MDNPPTQAPTTTTPTIPRLVIPPLVLPINPQFQNASSSTATTATTSNTQTSTQVSSSSSSDNKNPTSSSSSVYNFDKSKLSPYFLEYGLHVEYKYLKKHAPSGVYVLPSSDSILVWHGVIFVRAGYYRLGIFKFIINFPQDYPASVPNCRFATDGIFHPLISPVDGTIDLTYPFPNGWSEPRKHIWDALKYIKKIFVEFDNFPPPSPSHILNQEAFHLLTTDKEKFMAKASESVQLSIDNSLVNPEGSIIKFTEYNAAMHDPVRDTVLREKKEGPSLMSYLTKGVSSMSKIINLKY